VRRESRKSLKPRYGAKCSPPKPFPGFPCQPVRVFVCGLGSPEAAAPVALLPPHKFVL
jgi:hypothetical protein